MSLNRIGTGALRIAQQVASRVVNHNGTWLLKIVPRLHPPAAVQAVARVVPVPRALSRNPFMRMIQLSLRHSRYVTRPLSNLVMNHRAFYGWERPRYARRPLLFKKPRNEMGIVERVRDLFGTKERYNEHLKKGTLPDRLSAYDIGGNIGYGCNAAVYALRLQPDRSDPTPTSDRDLQAYPLALKLMFNYEHDRRHNEDGLWRGMGAELAPLPKAASLLKGRMGDFRPLPATHPNIVHVGTAFVDSMPILPDARSKYPEALPTSAIYEAIEPDPQTLFVVMRRYRMTLQSYLREPREKRISLWAKRVLAAQLLEGCAFLYKHKVAQRDMKSDNILLSYDKDGEIPQLVISDFGCALANGSFVVDYRHEGMDLGGNARTRAPEIALAKPPSTVDFSLADTWAAGALCYEIFTTLNPFYTVLSSATYKEYELPLLPERLPEPTKRAVAGIMRRDPQERLAPTIAANVLSLSLFRFGADLHELLPAFASEPIAKEIRRVSKRVDRVVDDMISLLAAETIAARMTSRELISRAELQLRATFMTRLARDELWAALGFFRESPAETDTGVESDAESAV